LTLVLRASKSHNQETAPCGAQQWGRQLWRPHVPPHVRTAPPARREGGASQRAEQLRQGAHRHQAPRPLPATYPTRHGVPFAKAWSPWPRAATGIPDANAVPRRCCSPRTCVFHPTITGDARARTALYMAGAPGGCLTASLPSQDWKGPGPSRGSASPRHRTFHSPCAVARAGAERCACVGTHQEQEGVLHRLLLTATPHAAAAHAPAAAYAAAGGTHTRRRYAPHACGTPRPRLANLPPGPQFLRPPTQRLSAHACAPLCCVLPRAWQSSPP
jgi:hypothetical protein